MLTICICLAIILGTEILFQKYDIFLSKFEFINALYFILLKHTFAPSVDLYEKYLFEYDNMDPFILLMFEGVIGVVLSSFLCFNPNYFDDFILVFKKFKGWKIVLFIFLIILYIILSALRNAFKMITTKIYSPMVRNLTDNVLTPLYLIFYFLVGYDFQSEKKPNYLYFTINLILSIIISICSCIYGEFIILFCCGLEKNTHDQISKRAKSLGFDGIYDVNQIEEESEISEDN